ncbi:prepilin-type N-terminal cleavage/methylation domain-containing protein [Candidatus Daviesbacteria bacterium]|nr:prepilin-type N-terminal cleavage/methylation domain-containing protein [Candidatus Daviesbacteria bacterium]
MPKKNGFTIVEILITITIIGILTLIAIPNFRKFNKEQLLRNFATDLIYNLRKAQINAQSGVKCPDGNPSVTWGINFLANSSYELIATCEGSNYTGNAVSTPNITLSTNCGAYPSVLKFNQNGVIYPDSSSCPSLGNQIFAVTLSDSTKNYILNIDKGGAIYENMPSPSP